MSDLAVRNWIGNDWVVSDCLASVWAVKGWVVSDWLVSKAKVHGSIRTMMKGIWVKKGLDSHCKVHKWVAYFSFYGFFSFSCFETFFSLFFIQDVILVWFI